MAKKDLRYKKEDLEKEDLEKVAQEFNTICDFEDPIALGDETDVKALKEDIKDVFENVLNTKEKEALTKKTKEVLVFLGLIEEEISKKDLVKESGVNPSKETVKEVKKKEKQNIKVTQKDVDLVNQRAVPKEVKKTEKKTEKNESTKVDKDKFGFTKGTKNSLFVKEICKKPTTMAAIKKKHWNKSGETFYELWGKLNKKKIGTKNSKKEMFIDEGNANG